MKYHVNILDQVDNKYIYTNSFGIENSLIYFLYIECHHSVLKHGQCRQSKNNNCSSKDKCNHHRAQMSSCDLQLLFYCYLNSPKVRCPALVSTALINSADWAPQQVAAWWGQAGCWPQCVPCCCCPPRHRARTASTTTASPSTLTPRTVI